VELAVDGWHHLVYATAAGAAYEMLDHAGWPWPRAGRPAHGPGL